MMTFIYLRDLRTRVTLRTLNVLNTLTVLKAEREPPPSSPPDKAPMVSSTIDSRTQVPSKRFIGSITYFYGPIARSFRAISTIKIHVKIKLY